MNGDQRLQVEVPEAFAELYEPSRYKIYFGGRGAGKSWQFGRAGVVKSLSRRIRVLCVREIQKSISDSVHKLLQDQIHELGLDKYFRITKDMIVGANGSEFIFKGLHNNANEIKSTEGVDICWVEEGQSVTAESWDILIPTIRKENSEIWVTFNPLNESDATYQKFIVNPPFDALVKKVNYWDNPYFPDVLRKEMEWLKEKDYQAYLHIWEGECRKLSKALVFGGRYRVEEFDTPDGVRFYHGSDWGFANDPTTLIRCFIIDRTIYIDAEAWGVGVDLDETPGLFDIIPTSRKWPIKADCARPETISFMKRRGFNISAAKKWQGSIEDGIEWLKAHDIVVHPRCVHLIDELEHYSYKQDKITGDILPVIVDKFNHCLVPGTKVLTESGEKNIEEVTTADKVLTRCGYKQVLWAGISGRDMAVYKVTTAEGNTLTGTADHRIYTEDGFRPIGRLKKGDTVLLCKQKSLRHTGENGEGIRTLRGGATGNTINAGQFISTNLFGKCSKESAGRVMSSTIRTETRKTTTLVILRRLLSRRTLWNITTRRGRKRLVNEWTLSDLLRLSGMDQKPERNGTGAMQRHTILGILTSRKGSALNAGQHLSQKHITRNFARILVRAKAGDFQALTILSKLAGCVAKNSRQINIQNKDFVAGHVATCTEAGYSSVVYDLTVEDAHEFFANGILVHNCIDALRYAFDGLIKGKGGMKINPKALQQLR